MRRKLCSSELLLGGALDVVGGILGKATWDRDGRPPPPAAAATTPITDGYLEREEVVLICLGRMGAGVVSIRTSVLLSRGNKFGTRASSPGPKGLPRQQGLRLLFFFCAFPLFRTNIWGTFSRGDIAHGLTSELSLCRSSLLSSRPQVKLWDQTGLKQVPLLSGSQGLHM